MNLDPRTFIEELGPAVALIAAAAVLIFVVVLTVVVAVAHRATRGRQEDPKAVNLQRRAHWRRTLTVGLALAVAATAAGGMAVARTAPTRSVAVPADSASPQEVVRAYLEASTVHDVDTMNVLVDPERMAKARRFRATWVVRDVRISASTDDRGEGVAYSDGELAAVDVRMFMVEGHSMSFPDDTDTHWGYWLRRSAPDQPWRIIDQGV